MQISRFDALYLKDFFAPEALEEPEIIEELEPVEPEPQFFSEEERAAAFEEGKKDGVAIGYEKGYAEAKAEQAAREEDVALAVKAVAASIEGMHVSYKLELEKAASQAHALAMMVAKKVAGAALDNNAPAMMAAMLERSMPMMMLKPHLDIEVHPDILEQAHLQLQIVIERAGFEGSTQMHPNNALGLHDIKINWQTGSAARSIDALWEELEAVMQRFEPNQLSTPEEN